MDNSRSRLALGVAVLVWAAAPARAQMAPNLVDDPGFESSSAGFTSDSGADLVSRSTPRTIPGNGSLRIVTSRATSTISWRRVFDTPHMGQALTVVASIRGDVLPQNLRYRLCAGARVDSSTATVEQCAPVNLAVGQVVRAHAVLRLDAGQPVTHVYLRLRHNGTGRFEAIIDDVSATLTPVGSASGARDGAEASGRQRGGSAVALAIGR
jgi:hypothetical protein